MRLFQNWKQVMDEPGSTEAGWKKVLSTISFLSLFSFSFTQEYTVGARIPNAFGFRMVDSVRIMVQTIRKPNFASLGRFT